MNIYGQGGMGGQQQMMISSSIAMVSLSVVAAAVALFGWQQGWFGKSQAQKDKEAADKAAADAAAAAVAAGPVVSDDLTGAKLITVGAFSMRVVGSSCGNRQISFSDAESTKWVWNLNKVGTFTIGSSTHNVYTIESYYKNTQEACEKSFLTAPSGCSSAPYLDRYKPMNNAQKWIIVGTPGNYQIRSLLCTRGNSSQQYLRQSAGNKYDRPFFAAGSGSPFQFTSTTVSSTYNETQ
ncbi:MAG: hypothetical protein ACO35C_03945 [Pontimonas sp.]